MQNQRISMTESQLRVFSWGLASFVIAISVFVWGDMISWNILPFNNYLYFPLFGLLAFGLMWSHYVVAVIRLITNHNKLVVQGYYKFTSMLVLVSLLLHPVLLNSQLYTDGYGLPPGSFQNYVASSMTWVVTLGLISLVVFLTFELHRFFGDRKWWKYVSYASDAAMLAIFYHGLQLGAHIQTGWFRFIWFFYGLTLIVAILYLKVLYPRYQKHIHKHA